MRPQLPLLLALAAAGLAACTSPPPPASQPGDAALTIVPDIEARVKQFHPVHLTADLSFLPLEERQAVNHLIAAARIMHRIYLRQTWEGHAAFAPKVAALQGPLAKPAQEYFRIMAGPWDALKEDEPFIGTAPKPSGAGFYPETLTKQQFEQYLTSHPEDKAALISLTTVVRSEGEKLVAIPYHQYYAEDLAAAASELRAAAALTKNASLKNYLELRAQAFLNDDYFPSDMAWMDLDSSLEVVLGPYETYDDALFGYKASYEAFICVRMPEDARRLEAYKGELPSFERNLPIPDEYKNLKRGSASPISVADEIFTAGDTRAGVQTVAFNLPNDERVREAKGSKKVLLKNMMHAKYDAILKPIAEAVLPPAEANKIDFDSFFHFILMHEMSHGLGPGRLTLNGRETEVRLELKEYYSALEEAKADALGVYELYALAEKKMLPPGVIEALPWTFTAGLFRTARFGTTEAHGLGVVIQTNWMLEHGALGVTPEGFFSPVPEKFKEAIGGLVRELLLIQARGDFNGARAMVEKWGKPSRAMLQRLGTLSTIPVDVDPHYPGDDPGWSAE